MVWDVKFPGYVEALSYLLGYTGDEGRSVVRLEGLGQSEPRDDALDEYCSHYVCCFLGDEVCFDPACE